MLVRFYYNLDGKWWYREAGSIQMPVLDSTLLIRFKVHTPSFRFSHRQWWPISNRLDVMLILNEGSITTEILKDLWFKASEEKVMVISDDEDIIVLID